MCRPRREVRDGIGPHPALGLNVGRLCNLRRAVYGALARDDDAELMLRLAYGQLLPNNDGSLPQFFSVARSAFGLLAERILADAGDRWV